MNKMNETTSENVINKSIKALQELFPETIMDDGKVNFDVLKSLLSENLSEDQGTTYGFNWFEKDKYSRLAQLPTSATLLPNRAKSKDWDITNNIYIEGDNLEVLKILQKAYSEKVQLIYLDPPYNTGKDFVYHDDFHNAHDSYLRQTGQIDEVGNSVSTNKEASGRFHTDWLNMMYPRLKLARNLMKRTGVIFVSIDFHESANLRKMLDEIFGEQNFVADIAWRRSDNQANIGTFATVRDSILVYAKNYEEMTLGRLPLSEKAKKEYSYEDNEGRYRRGILKDEVRGRYNYDVTSPNGLVHQGPWMVSESEFAALNEQGKIHWPENGGIPHKKLYLRDVMKKGQIPNDFWDTSFGTNQRGNTEIKSLFGFRAFDFVKPKQLLKNILSLGSPNDDDIVLDFFSGSSTTADAVMSYNADNGTNKKFIMVQLPETLVKGTDAYDRGYRTIPDIAQDRIRLAGQLLNEEQPLNDVDTGFKVFELATTNIRDWEPRYSDKTQTELVFSANNLVEGRSNEDVMYEILIKKGLQLTLPISKTESTGATIFDIAFGTLYIISGSQISESVVDSVIESRKAYEKDGMFVTSNVIFVDDSFTDSETKLNIVARLNDAGFTSDEIESI